MKTFVILLILNSILYSKCEQIDVFKRAINRTFIGFEKENNTNWLKSFHFIQGADTQFGLIETFLQNKTDGGWDEEIALTEQAINEWNSMQPKPKFVVICGDLVDDKPIVSQKRRDKQLIDFKKVMKKLDNDIPLVLLGGNHDFLDSPTIDSVNAYRSEFGDDFYSFWSEGCMFIVINVQFYKNHTFVDDLYEEQHKWLDSQLTQVKRGHYNHVFVFQHIPWFLHNISEPLDEMFNIEYKTRLEMIKKFSEAGVRAIFAGHYHRNAGGFYENMELVVNSAIGGQSPSDANAKSGYRIVTVNEFNISHEYREIQMSRTNTIFEFNLLRISILLLFAYLLKKALMN